MIPRLMLAASALALAAAPGHAQDTVRIGTEGAYPPFNLTDSAGELAGYEIDLARDLCRRMEAECAFVAQDWDGIIPALLNGRYDAIMAAMNVTEERKERIAFSRAYVTTPVVAVAPADADLQQAETGDALLDALGELTVGVQVATIFQDLLEQQAPEADVRLYDTQEQLQLDLVAGRIDAGVADAFAWTTFLDSEEGADFAVAGPGLVGADYPLLGEGMGVGLRQEDEALKARFDEAICDAYRDGTLTELSIKWFGFDASVPCVEDPV